MSTLRLSPSFFARGMQYRTPFPGYKKTLILGRRKKDIDFVVRAAAMMPLRSALAVAFTLVLGSSPTRAQVVPTADAVSAYDSWKLALPAGAATDPATFTLLPGFRAELIRTALPEEGSWVAMAFDPQGRLTLAREKRGLLRVAFEAEKVAGVEVIDDTLLECRGLLYAHGALFANANNSKALHRLRDADGDGTFEENIAILRTEGGVGHGRNHVKLGPDGRLYVAHGNNVRPPAGLSPRSPVTNGREDQLIPNPSDATMFDGDLREPAGHILRLDPDGGNVELFAAGFRNPLDLAFNRDGEMFTFDADMEWDVGTPWYMPNRVLHVVSGADFGWRRGAGRFPASYPETLPSVLDAGLASPTAVIFGHGAKFPARYERALFICDWAYGRILAVHLQPDGASYRGTSELFASGRPLNVTDACIGQDGAMWFITGGRGTQSGLYRLAYAGSAGPEAVPAEDPAGARLRGLRHRREKYHTRLDADTEADALGALWSTLGHRDRFVRHASRVALEHLPLAWWQEKALGEDDAPRALTALLALVRTAEPSVQSRLLERLQRLPLAEFDDEQLLAALRIHALTFIRLGAPDEAARAAALRRLEPLYPHADAAVSRELCELLVYLRSPEVIAKTAGFLAGATTSEDLLHFPFFLRHLSDGWTPEARQACIDALDRAALLPGARQYQKVVEETRADLLAALPPGERAPFRRATTTPVSLPAAAKFVKAWSLEDFQPLLESVSLGRSFAGGKAAAVAAHCVVCHRVSDDPALPASILGPDLRAVASRFGRRDLLEHILHPAKAVDEKYRATPMPAGLLHALSAEEILDLLAFLEAGGDPGHALFSPATPAR